MTFTTARCIAATAALVLAGGVAAATYYKWVDDEGVVHYGETPPPDREAQPLHPVLPPAPPPSPRRDAPAAAADAEPTAPASSGAAGGEDDPEFRRKACAWARSELAGAERANRVFRTTADGTRVRLSEEERQARIAELRSKVDEYCR